MTKIKYENIGIKKIKKNGSSIIIKNKKQSDWNSKQSHYFKNYMRKNNLSQIKVAHILGCSEQTVKRMVDCTDQRLINAFEHIDKLASLDNKNILDFVSYILGISPTQRVSGLHTNEKSFLEAYNKAELIAKRNFSEKYCENENELCFAEIIKIFSLLPKLDLLTLKMISMILMQSKSNQTQKDLNTKTAILNDILELIKIN